MATDKSVRLDKWLWAARFFKTRAIAKKAIDGGKIHCDGVRGKPSRLITVGMMIKVRQGFSDKMVQVLDLSENRGSATMAQKLYAETEKSIAEREKIALQRKALPTTSAKPDKKQRRQIQQFIRKQSE